MSSDEDMLDVFCLWGSILEQASVVVSNSSRASSKLSCSRDLSQTINKSQHTLILVAPLTDFSNELDMLMI